MAQIWHTQENFGGIHPKTYRFNGTTYHVQILRKGLKPLTKSFSNRTLAQQWARQTESVLERSEYLDLTEAKITLFSEILTRYSNEVAIKLKGWSQEQSRCRGLSERLGDRALTNIRPALLAEYREERLGQVSPKTVREELSLLQRVLRHSLYSRSSSQSARGNGCYQPHIFSMGGPDQRELFFGGFCPGGAAVV